MPGRHIHRRRSPLRRRLAHENLYAWLPALIVPLQLGAIAAGTFIAADPALSPPRFVGLLLAVGTTSGVFGMLAAHELIHGRRRIERLLGLVMLAGCGYMHFRISHLQGHHRAAATPDDPATARRGEDVYRFVLRSVVGQYRQAWHAERRRSRVGESNRMLRYLAVTALIYAGVAILAGPRGVLFLALQSLLAVFILEVFNYIAHYGLMRRQGADGRYEPLGPEHSWNTARRFSNWALLNAGGHSHHHAEPGRAYQHLGPVSGALELPAGYGGSVLLALVPPLWYRVIDPRLPAN